MEREDPPYKAGIGSLTDFAKGVRAVPEPLQVKPALIGSLRATNIFQPLDLRVKPLEALSLALWSGSVSRTRCYLALEVASLADLPILVHEHR